MLTESTETDKVEITTHPQWKMGGVRTATVVYRDDVEISRSNHRKVISPIDDWSAEPADVQAICNLYHDADAIAAFQASLNSSE